MQDENAGMSGHWCISADFGVKMLALETLNFMSSFLVYHAVFVWKPVDATNVCVICRQWSPALRIICDAYTAGMKAWCPMSHFGVICFIIYTVSCISLWISDMFLPHKILILGHEYWHHVILIWGILILYLQRSISSFVFSDISLSNHSPYICTFLTKRNRCIYNNFYSMIRRFLANSSFGVCLAILLF
jgi:hypothetical protein